MNSTKVGTRRKLRFESIDELRAEVDRIVAAEQSGDLERLGNWSAGQMFGHVAAWINYSYDGYPFKLPWIVRVIVQTQLKRFARKGLWAGVRLPWVKGGTYATEPLSTDEGTERLRAALARLESDEPAECDRQVFGPLSREDRIQLNLRHAELHLSFLRYDDRWAQDRESSASQS